MKRVAFSWLALVILTWFLACPLQVMGYGDGGGGGGEGGEGNSVFGDESAAGGVSWGTNPNGENVMGSSIWEGRPEAIHHGPYQPDTAVEDAEAALLSGLDSGAYTPEQVRDQLNWAQSVGIKLSPQALNFLAGLGQNPVKSSPAAQQPPPSPQPSQPAAGGGPSKPSKIDKQNQRAAQVLSGISKVTELLRGGGNGKDAERLLQRLYDKSRKNSKTPGNAETVWWYFDQLGF